MRNSKLNKLCCLLVAFTFIVSNNAYALTNLRISSARTNPRFLNQAFGLDQAKSLVRMIEDGFDKDLLQTSEDIAELEEMVKRNNSIAKEYTNKLKQLKNQLNAELEELLINPAKRRLLDRIKADAKEQKEQRALVLSPGIMLALQERDETALFK